MKLDVSDVLYDSSSVSSDSGTSQSSRVSHDFLSSITNSSILPSNVPVKNRTFILVSNAFIDMNDYVNFHFLSLASLLAIDAYKNYVFPMLHKISCK